MPERHGDVARPARVADAVDRRTAHALLELRGAPAKQIRQGRAAPGRARTARRNRRARQPGRKVVPGAHQLAVIAAVDAVAEGRAQLLRDGARVFDGEIGDAAPCIHAPGRDDRPGRAGRQARGAAAAVRTCGLILGQRQVGENLPEEEPGTRVAGDQVAVLADPAQARIARMGALQNRRGVGTQSTIAVAAPACACSCVASRAAAPGALG